MTDVFISYAREDRGLVERIHEALSREGRDAWVDWEGIPITAQWWAEICAAIDAADSVVFVTSPDSLQSAVCLEELGYARSRNKRIVPIIARPVPAAEMPEGLAAINWLSMTEDDDFDDQMVRLLEVLDTDLDWVRAHTRLLVRAREWDQNGRDSSFLLRGRDLQEAEAWSTRRPTTGPSPTGLHAQFVLASRRLAQRRQRVLLGAVSAGLLITSVLAAVAYVQRENAIEQARIARSRELATHSMSGGSADQERAVLLAIEAVRLAPGDQAVGALRRALSASRLVARLRGHSRAVSAAVFTPDGNSVVSASYDRSVRLWDVRSGAQRQQYLGHTETVDDVALSSDGRLLATAGRDGSARLWELESGKLLNAFKASSGASWMTEVLLAPDGSEIATLADGGSLSIWDAQTGRLRRSKRLHMSEKVVGAHWSERGLLLAIAPFSRTPTVQVWSADRNALIATLAGQLDPIEAAIFDARGERLLTVGHGDTARLWQVETGRMIARYPGHEYGVDSAALSEDGSRVATAGPSQTIYVWDAATGERLQTLRGHTHTVRSVAFSRDGESVVTASDDGSARLWDTATGETLAVLRGHSDAVTRALFSPRGNLVLTASNDRTLRVWLAGSAEHKLLREAGAGAQPPDRSARLSRDGELLLVWKSSTQLQVVGVRSGEIVVELEEPSGFNDARFGRSANELLTINGSGTIVLLDLERGDRRRTLAFENVTAVVAALSADGRLLALAGGDGSIRVGPVDDPGALATLGGHASLITGIDVAAGNELVASAAWDGSVRLWDLASRRRKFVLSTDQQPDGVSFSANGRYVVTWSRGNIARIWDSRSGRQVSTLRGHTEWVTQAQFSADTELVATASNDGTVRIWETVSGEPLTSFDGELGPLSDVVFAGDRVIAATPAGAVIEWPCVICLDPRLMLASACKTVTRNLSHDEWRQYFGAMPYRKTCESAPVHVSYVESVRELAQSGDLQKADARLRAIARLDPGAISDIEKERRLLAASALFEEGARSLADGEVVTAMERFNAVDAGYPQFAVPFDAWNAVCWKGAVSGWADQVLSSCEKAVRLTPKGERGPVRDSRGLARALSNNREGAIKDFQAFVRWAEDDDMFEDQRRLRQQWIETLQAGGNPFDEKTLSKLKEEVAPY